MDVVDGAVRVISRTADVTTAAAGAVSGAAINGVIGGVQGAATGLRDGLAKGSHSSAAAALTLGAVGAVGLVEWPLLLTVGGGALVLHRLSQRSDGNGDRESAPAPLRSAPTGSAPTGSASAQSAAQPRKTTRSRHTTSR